MGKGTWRFDGSAWYRREMDRRTRAVLKREDELAEAACAGEDACALLDRVRVRAEALGHAPQMNEVPGARAIAERFGGWQRVLHRLGCKYPAGSARMDRTHRYREEYDRQQELYRAERSEKKQRRMERVSGRHSQTAEQSQNGVTTSLPDGSETE
ncbi:MAG: hypothetical protein IKQ73_04660 [Oscillospiraceae bacterium]|nr:hypothetical protein [Oscillospiraceae bacterium]